MKEKKMQNPMTQEVRGRFLPCHKAYFGAFFFLRKSLLQTKVILPLAYRLFMLSMLYFVNAS